MTHVMASLRGVSGDLLRVDDRLPLGQPYQYSINGSVLEFVFNIPGDRANEPWTHFQIFMGKAWTIRPLDGYPTTIFSGDDVSIVQRVEVKL